MKNLFIILALTGCILSQELDGKELSLGPYGKDTYKLYSMSGLGLSLTENYCRDNDDCIDAASDDGYDVSSVGIEIFGFYKHIGSRTFLGAIMSGKWDKWETESTDEYDNHYNYGYSSHEIQLSQYLFSVSFLNFINNLRKGPFFRAEMGYARSSLSGVSLGYYGGPMHQHSSWSNSLEFQTGSGVRYGVGYSFEITNRYQEKSAILVGLYYTEHWINGYNDNYVNLLVSFFRKTKPLLKRR